MPRRSKGPRLWLQPATTETEKGKIIEQAVWVIRDGSVKRSTGCGPREIEEAAGKLRDYLNESPRNGSATVTHLPSSSRT